MANHIMLTTFTRRMKLFRALSDIHNAWWIFMRRVKLFRTACEMFATRSESSDHFHTPYEIIQSALKYSQRVVNIRTAYEMFSCGVWKFQNALRTLWNRWHCIRASAYQSWCTSAEKAIFFQSSFFCVLGWNETLSRKASFLRARHFSSLLGE